MTLSDVATFSTAISGLTVTASLIYLALQTHQSAKHTKALIQQGRTNAALIANVGFSDTDKVIAYLKGNGGTATQEEVERQQFALQCSSRIVTWLDAFTQHADGLLNDDHLSVVSGNMNMALRGAGFRRYWNGWKTARPNSNAKFKAFVDDIVAKAARSEV